MLTIRVIWTTFLSFSILFALFVHIELLQENKNMKVSTYLIQVKKLRNSKPETHKDWLFIINCFELPLNWVFQ